MTMQRNMKKTIGLILLAVMLVAIAVLGVRVASLLDRTLEEAATTPTPVPAFGNVMQVTPDPNAPTPEPVLRTGSQGEEVWALQMRLMELGYYREAVDGQFGAGTKEAVRAFQAQHGLGADGVVGAQTRAMLESAAAQTAAPTTTPSPTPNQAVANDDMPMLVNRQYAVPNGYAPDNLVVMNTYCDSAIVTIKEDNTRGQREAVDALMAMLRAAHGDGVTVWQISEGYRTTERQQELFDEAVAEYRRTNNLSASDAASAARLTVADPGQSEHHTGLAFDITVPGTYFRDTEQAKWLAEHCWDYGFIIRYQEEKQPITGYMAEPWHVRYVGTAHSLIMRDENLCLEEYLAQKGLARITITPVTLQSGSKGALVEQLQRRLAELGYYTGAIDGDFGPGTQAAVEAFQKQSGLNADGIAGERTQEALNSATAATAPPVQ